MRQHDITPIVIFDGRPPSYKEEVLEQRKTQRTHALNAIDDLKQELTVTDISQIQKAFITKKISGLLRLAPNISGSEKEKIKQFLYGAGVLFISAMGEADDVLAYLSRSKQIDAVLSTDMDMLARGIETLILPETNDATLFGEIRTSELLSGLKITYTQFVDACILMGTDYTGSEWKTINPTTAFDMVRKGVSWERLNVSIDVRMQIQHGIRSLQGIGYSWESILSESQRVKWIKGSPEKEPETIRAFCKEYGWDTQWSTILVGEPPIFLSGPNLFEDFQYSTPLLS